MNFKESTEYKGDGSPLDTIAIVPFLDQSDYAYQIHKIQKEIEGRSNGTYKVLTFDKSFFTRSVPLKFSRKDFLYQSVPEKANITSGGYCPKVLLFINDFQIDIQEKPEEFEQMNTGTGTVSIFKPAELLTDVTISFVYWDNRTNQIISFGRFKERVAKGAFYANSTSERAQKDIEKIARKILDKIPKK